MALRCHPSAERRRILVLHRASSTNAAAAVCTSGQERIPSIDRTLGVQYAFGLPRLHQFGSRYPPERTIFQRAEARDVRTRCQQHGQYDALQQIQSLSGLLMTYSRDVIARPGEATGSFRS